MNVQSITARPDEIDAKVNAWLAERPWINPENSGLTAYTSSAAKPGGNPFLVVTYVISYNEQPYEDKA